MGIHAVVMGGLNIVVKDIVEYLDAEWASCLGNGELHILLKVL